ncbi:hypothetical protein, partial [Candidatus Hakubella thermalkaliphila]|uniref:hypothetical protein n=1 Tax=Candidatus Hakubella thermalkaliphila TaxID=2754717 RepID=UPI001593531D
MKKRLWSLSAVLRTVVLVLLALAIINPSLSLLSSPGKLVVLVDESRSVKDLVGDANQLVTPYL